MRARNKRFLNDAHTEGGSISWFVLTGGDRSWVSGTLESEVTIKSCNSSITLDLDCEEVYHIHKRVEKLTVLIEELEKLKEQLLLSEEQIKRKQKFYY